MIQKLQNLKQKARNANQSDLRHVIEDLIQVIIDKESIKTNALPIEVEIKAESKMPSKNKKK